MTQSLTLPFQGFLNALVYGWTRDDFVNKVTQQRLMEETTTLIEQEPLHEPTDGMVLVRENPYNASGENIRVLNFDEESLDQEHMVTSIEESNLH